MTDRRQFDLIVIGTGPAGTAIATEAAKRGKSVAIIESMPLGGTCALRGCNPKKVYTQAANLVEQTHNASYLQSDAPPAKLDWPALFRFQRGFVDPVPQKWQEKFDKAGVHVLKGTARFTGPTELAVNDETYTAAKFAIATGAVPAPLHFPGHEFVKTSDQFLEQSDLPCRVAFIGGGYISLEFANVVAASGRSVAIIDRHARVLKQFDPDLVGLLTKHMQSRSIHFELGQQIASIDRLDDGTLQIKTDRGNQIDCDMVVHGAGRVANIESLNLSAANIDADRSGIFVDAYLRSRSNPNVYVAGDCVAGETARLTPTAEYHADIVTKNLLSEHPSARRGEVIIPAVAFTVPCLASVGLSEEQTREQGRRVAVRFENVSTKGNVRKALHAVAAHKFIIDTASDLILGAHLLGPGAEEVINLFALAMQHHLTATQLKSMYYGYPTFSADIRSML